MGRQYNFYMGREDEELFLEYLKQNQYVVYQDDKDGNPKNIDKWPEPYSDAGWFILYLYRKDFGEMIFSDSLGDGRLFIHPTDAPVIEFVRTCINLKDKRIVRCRIWLEMNQNRGETGNAYSGCGTVREDCDVLTNFFDYVV